MAPKGDSENIKVAVRCRPMNSSEKAQNYVNVIKVDYPSTSVNLIGAGAQGQQKTTYTFDYVFDNAYSQTDIFQQICVPMCESVMSGFNATIFAYGQSGTGKTHTMSGVVGDPVLEGISPRAFKYMLSRIQETHARPDSKIAYRLQASYLEIYNAKVRDLLAEDPDKNLPIKEGKDKNFYVPDLLRMDVKELDHLLELVDTGTSRRKTESTNLNAVSSRSHAVFTVTIESTETLDDGSKRLVTSKLNLVDLAGSERQGKTGAEGDRLKEGSNINLSLSALGHVIDSLVKGAPHIPFRSSPLTMLLRDSLGGGSKTLMFANMGPSEHNVQETISTLRFADRAKQIKNKPQLQMDAKDLRIFKLEEEVKQLKEKLAKYGAGETDDDALEALQTRISELEAEVGAHKSTAEEAQRNIEVITSQHQQEIEELRKKLGQAAEDAEEAGMASTVARLDSKGMEKFSDLFNMTAEHIKRMTKIMSAENTVPLDKLAPNTQAADVLESTQLLLDTITQLAGKGIASTRMEEEIANARKAAEKELESRYGKQLSDKTAEIGRLQEMNKQSQVGLVQAVDKLKKFKEKVDKEKKEKKELQAKYDTHIEEQCGKHDEECKKLKDMIAELEADLKDPKRRRDHLKRSRSMLPMQDGLGGDVQDVKSAAASQILGDSTQSTVPGGPPPDDEFPDVDMDDVDQVTAELVKMKRDMKLAVDAKEAEIETLAKTHESKLESINRELQEVQESLREAQNERDTFKSRYDEAVAERSEATAKCGHLEAENEKLTADLGALLVKNSELESRVPELLHYKQQADMEIDNAKALAERLERKISERDSSVEQKNAILEKQKELLEKRKTRERELLDRVAELEQSLEGAVRDAEQRIDEAVERLTRTQNERMAEVVSTHQNEMKNLREQMHTRVKKLNKQVEKQETLRGKAEQVRDEQIVRAEEMSRLVEELKEQLLRFQRGISDEQYEFESQQKAAAEQIRKAKEKRAEKVLGGFGDAGKDSSLDARNRVDRVSPAPAVGMEPRGPPMMGGGRGARPQSKQGNITNASSPSTAMMGDSAMPRGPPGARGPPGRGTNPFAPRAKTPEFSDEISIPYEGSRFRAS